MAKYSILFCVLSLLVLTGCVSREQADARLGRACTAAAELFIAEGNKVKEVKNQIYGTDKMLGNGYRRVTVQAVETDGWYDADKEYLCVFVETFGPFKLNHQATVYQVQVDGKIYGKEGDKILGTFNDHLKLTETVEKSLMGP